MERYEYQVVKAPTKSIKFKGLKKTDDAFALTLMEGMNGLARDGWQFVRTEIMVEQRRSVLGNNTRLEHDYMVYRRALRSDGMTMSQPVAPKRVRRENLPSVELIQDRIAPTTARPIPIARVAC